MLLFASTWLVARTWPDGLDLALIGMYAALIVGVPAVAYALMYLDLRAYYRRIRQALVVVSRYTTGLPKWVARESWASRQLPPCLQAFGLNLPFTEAELLTAYRLRVKDLHPDRGGDRAEFLQLQQHFEEARSLLTAGDEPPGAGIQA